MRWRVTAAALCVAVGCSGLQEADDVCSVDTPGHGSPCGTCGVLQCSSAGGLECVIPAEPRDDVRIALPPGLVRALGARAVTATIDSDLDGAPGPVSIPIRDAAVQGCLPGLTGSTTVRAEVELALDGVTIAELVVGPVAIRIFEPLEAESPQLILPDDDEDGATNLEEALDDPDLAADPAAVPDGFRDRLLDVVRIPTLEVLDSVVPITDDSVFVFTSSAGLDGRLHGSFARLVDTSWHGVRPPTPLPCLIHRAVGHPTRARAVVLCDPSLRRVFVAHAATAVDLFVDHEVELPLDFTPVRAVVPDGSMRAYVLGRGDSGARLATYDTETGALDVAPPLEGLVSFADLDQVSGRLVASAPEDNALVELSTEGGVSVVSRLDLPGAPDRVLASGSEIWVTMSAPPAVLITTLTEDGFSDVETIELDERVVSLAADGADDRWIYGGTGRSLLRFSRPFRRLQDRVDMSGQGPPAVWRDLARRDGQMFANLAGHFGVGVIGWSQRVARETAERPQPLGPDVQRVVGQAAARDPGAVQSGLPEEPGDVIEDLYAINPPGERLVVLRPTNPGTSMVLTQVRDEAPARTVRKADGTTGFVGQPLVLPMPAGPGEVGVSLPDGRAETGSAYVLDLVEVPAGLTLVDEVEDAADLTSAPELPMPSRLSGRVGPDEVGPVEVRTLSGGRDDLEDLFRLPRFGTGVVAYLELTSPEADVDLYLVDAAGEVLKRSTLVDPLDADEFIVHEGGDGPFYLGVSAFEGVETGYRLTVVPMRFGPP